VSVDGSTHSTRRERIRDMAVSAQRRVQDARKSSPSVDAAFVVQLRDRTVGGNLLASAIAYRLFLWMLPVALLMASLLGFAQASGRDQPEQVGEDLGLGKSVISTVAGAASQAEKSRYLLLFIALFGIYFAGAAGAKTLIAVHRFAWGLSPIGPRVTPLASLAFTGAAVAVACASALAGIIRDQAHGIGLVAMVIVALLDASVWFGLSLLLPHAGAPWTRLVPGALLVGVGMQLVHVASVYYLSNKIETASQLYGGLGFAATILLGLYLLARLMVASAVLNATLWSRAETGRASGGSLPEGEARDTPQAG
jgi:uncharacterized BrkB/YihY/UPF0761 family membrane protein